jgi:fatty acid desaturase
MATTTANDHVKRDYSLHGASTQQALQQGLASAKWYHSDVERKTMKDLMQRHDGPAMRDTLIWFAALGLSAAGGIYYWGTWWCVPFWAVYGVMYGSACDSRWHEMGHGTAFRTQWMNKWVYNIASFMVMRNPVNWRWSHARHHTDTIIVGRDVEIALMRPPALIMWIGNFFGIPDAYYSLKVLIRNALGMLSGDEKDYIPETEWHKAINAARIHMFIYIAAVAAALAFWSWIPLTLIGLPRLYGCWHMVLVGLLQHGGLAENVLDHRLNSRTVYMNPISRFIYLNMNYHVEHHMFPMVPYYALPRLHDLIKHDLPAPNTSILDGYREMVPALLRQLKNEEYFIRKQLPASAKPYRAEFHALPETVAAG